MNQFEKRLRALEPRQPGKLERVAIIGEGEEAPPDADQVIVLCSPKMDGNGRALAGE